MTTTVICGGRKHTLVGGTPAEPGWRNRFALKNLWGQTKTTGTVATPTNSWEKIIMAAANFDNDLLARLLAIVEEHFAEEYSYFADTCVAIATKGRLGKLYPSYDLGPAISAAFASGYSFASLERALTRANSLSVRETSAMLTALASNADEIKATIAALVHDTIYGDTTLPRANPSLFQVLAVEMSGAPLVSIVPALDARVKGALADLKMHNDALNRATANVQRESLARNLVGSLTTAKIGVKL
jgi:hypothetical protein